MNYATSETTRFFSWLFTLNGILSVIILGGMIWLIISFIMNNKNGKQNNRPNNSSSGHNFQPHDSEMASEKSFWDDFNKNEDFPQREEEPIPPNAIPPTSTYMQSPTEEMRVRENCDLVKNADGIWEKDCTKQIIEDDVIFDDVVKNDIPMNQDVNIIKEEKGE